MTKRITLTVSTDELTALVKLRNALEPGRPLATFAGDVLAGAVEAELHAMECQCHMLSQALYVWQPEGRPN